MLKSNDPAINVEELMERVRREAANRRTRLRLSEAEKEAPPQVRDALPPPPQLPATGRVDPKADRLSDIVARARAKTTVSRRIPKVLRRLFRRQGGYNELLLEAVDVLTSVVSTTSERVRNLVSELDRRDGWLRELDKVRRMRVAAGERARRLLLEDVGQLRSDFEAKSQQLVEVVEQVRGDGARSGEHLRNLQSEIERVRHLFTTLQQQLGRVEQSQVTDAAFVKAELACHSALLTRNLPIATPDSPRTESSEQEPHSHQFDAFYLALENQFRGSRHEIKDRLRYYLRFIEQLKVDREQVSALDLGCGRGEWLELLAENNIRAIGVDSNHVMLGECKQRSFDVAQADVAEYLRSQPDRCHTIVTGFHLLEHLPFQVLMEVIRQTQRILARTGVAIFESPNCKNLIVGACNFYIDPTHRIPLFPDTAKLMLETAGFERVTVEYLHPMEVDGVQKELEEHRKLRELLYGPEDFAIIGYKPAGK